MDFCSFDLAQDRLRGNDNTIRSTLSATCYMLHAKIGGVLEDFSEKVEELSCVGAVGDFVVHRERH